jgi:4-diphosphocytidyl-2-C-methyl-D-erythritol kinase
VTELLYRCYAKVNFTLEISGKRADGFHELESVVHTISLADDLRIESADTLECRVEGLEIELETNLVWRAARLLAAHTGERRGARLTLVKRIPAAGGLGGGSTDAATALVGLNRLWGNRLSFSELGDLAAQLGSDVPFFIRGGAALMQGRGERLDPLTPNTTQWLVVAVAAHDISDKTRRLYGALTPADFSTGQASHAAVALLQAGDALSEKLFVNTFERAARAVFPGLDAQWSALEKHYARAFYLSGAGPALFALAEDRLEALRIARQIEASGTPAYATRTVKHARASIRVAAP